MHVRRRLTIYTRPDCGLCERMRDQVEACIAPLNVALTLIDISGRDDLEERFGERVPVLYVDDSELCYGRLDQDLLEEALVDIR